MYVCICVCVRGYVCVHACVCMCVYVSGPEDINNQWHNSFLAIGKSAGPREVHGLSNTAHHECHNISRFNLQMRTGFLDAW